MKRASFHNKHPIYVNVEDARYKDFIELCDNEHKTFSLKLNELITKELDGQKKVEGETTRIPILHHEPSNTYVCPKEKPFQSKLTDWLQHVDQVRDHKELVQIINECRAIATRADKRSMELYRQGIKIDK